MHVCSQSESASPIVCSQIQVAGVGDLLCTHFTPDSLFPVYGMFMDCLWCMSTSIGCSSLDIILLGPILG